MLYLTPPTLHLLTGPEDSVFDERWSNKLIKNNQEECEVI